MHILILPDHQHTSTALTSLCTIGYSRAYFANGTLPAEGTVCQVDEGAFSAVSNSTSSNSNSTATGAVAAVANSKSLVSLGSGSSTRRLSDFIHRGINANTGGRS